MRSGSAIARGRSGGRSTRTGWRPPPLRNVFRARSTSTATLEGSGATVSVPASMLPASSRFAMRPRMWSACPSMMRKNWSISAWGGGGAAPSTVAVEPLIEVSGARSSWLTIPRNSDRCRSSSSSGSRSCMVTTTDTSSPSSEWIGVTLMSVRTLRPSGTDSSISSARIVVASSSCRARGNSSSEISCPSACRNVITSRSCSVGWPGVRIPSTMRWASRLNDTGRPVLASKTTTPTGEVSTRASRLARARSTSRCVRALAIAVAACEANRTRISSSSAVNASPSSLSARKKCPRCSPPWCIGVPCSVFAPHGFEERPSEPR